MQQKKRESNELLKFYDEPINQAAANQAQYSNQRNLRQANLDNFMT